jgi:hypothetical protein
MFHPGEKRLTEALERMSLIPEITFKEDLKQLAYDSVSHNRRCSKF